MPITNTDTQTSPGIGPLPDGYSIMGGCIVDILGTSGHRVTAQISASTMFKGWVPLSHNWQIVGTTAFGSESMLASLGGGIAKANLRITLYDGDSGSPNPVYVAMFGPAFPYVRSTPQPADYDFDGGHNLYFGFQDVDGNPVNCGYMGECTTYRLGADQATYDTFTGFPGTFALTDPYWAPVAKPAHYMTPVQAGAANGIWPVTGWFSVPDESLAALYAVLATGTIQVGVHDITPGDQYYDFTQGLAVDTVSLPFEPLPVPVQHHWLDLWVWRQLEKFTSLDENLNFPPGAMRALLYSLACELYENYPEAAKKYKFEELLADTEEALKEYEALNAANAVAEEPKI